MRARTGITGASVGHGCGASMTHKRKGNRFLKGSLALTFSSRLQFSSRCYEHTCFRRQVTSPKSYRRQVAERDSRRGSLTTHNAASQARRRAANGRGGSANLGLDGAELRREPDGLSSPGKKFKEGKLGAAAPGARTTELWPGLRSHGRTGGTRQGRREAGGMGPGG